MANWHTYRLLILTGLSVMIGASVDSVYAQCVAYGDPIINITFGNDQDPVEALPAERIPGYTFNRNDANRPGSYTIVSRGRDAGFIYHDFANHTEGDPNGRMLVVNANEEPGIFYTEIQPNLCPNTSFSFSAAIMNASPPDLACRVENNGIVEPINARFEIQTLSGEVIASYDTGVIQSTATPQWRQVSLTFDTGNHTEVRLVMQNIGPGGCGNNIAIDDIQFRPCGPETQLLPQDIAVEIDTVFLCISSREVTFRSEIGAGYITEVYQWQQRMGLDGEWQDIPGEIDSTLTVEPAHDTWYRLAVASTVESMGNPQCRVASAPMRAAHARLPAFPVSSADRQTCEGTSITLDPPEYAGPDVGPLTYQWYRHLGDGNWEGIPGAEAVDYVPDVTVAGIIYYQRRGVNVCGQGFPTDEFTVVTVAWEETSLDLPVTTVCLDDNPYLLTGGTPVEFGTGEPGVYSGTGVTDNYFNPAIAGIGVHAITYVPAAAVPCPLSSTAHIQVVEPIVVEPMEDRHVIAGRSVRLHVRDNNGVAYQWDNPQTLDRSDVADPMASPSVSTTYRVAVTNAGGCVAIGEIRVHVLEHLEIPTAFTPNGDQINDVWEIRGLEHYPDVQVRVFNRWGSVVYTSKGYSQPWDGRFNAADLPAATYYYIIESTVLSVPVTGAVTILR